MNQRRITLAFIFQLDMKGQISLIESTVVTMIREKGRTMATTEWRKKRTTRERRRTTREQRDEQHEKAQEQRSGGRDEQHRRSRGKYLELPGSIMMVKTEKCQREMTTTEKEWN